MLALINETVTEQHKLTVCLSGIELLQQPKFQSYFREIRSLVSCPDRIFRQLYLATLYHFAEFCQAMPFSVNEFNTSHGFLERQLKLVVAVLKLRRGFLFPKNAGAEQISEEEAQWTYALFAASLLKDLHQLQSNREVTLHHADGKQAGIWLSLSGSLYKKNIYYSMKFLPQNLIIERDILMAAFSGSIFPPDAITWLAGNSYLFEQWWSVILHQASQENDIEKIIQIAAEKSGITFVSQSVVTDKPDLQEEFIKQLLEGVKQNSEHIFKTQDGLFVHAMVLEDFLSANKFISKSTFLEGLEKSNWIVLNDQEYNHDLYPKKYEDKRIFHGIVLNTDILPEELQRLTLNVSFQKQISKL
jgi:hypothetical protein